jgi:ParB family chromosome partitioning protein
VMVRPRGGGHYELVAGERRFRAAQQAGLTRIPAVVRSLTDEESLTVALIENIQREDLNPIEAARGYKQLMEDFGLTQTQLGQQIGKKQSTISNVMGLLKLPAEIQDSIADGRLSMEHGKILLSVDNPVERLVVWRDFLDLGMSRNEAREHAKAAQTLTSRAPAKPAQDLHWKDLEDRFKRAFAMKVDLRPGRRGGGTLTVRFSQTEDLEHILEKLQRA